MGTLVVDEQAYQAADEDRNLDYTARFESLKNRAGFAKLFLNSWVSMEWGFTGRCSLNIPYRFLIPLVPYYVIGSLFRMFLFP